MNKSLNLQPCTHLQGCFLQAKGRQWYSDLWYNVDNRLKEL